MRHPTLHDLAKDLQLSISTVSRALIRPELVKPATREKVFAAVKRVGFSPNGVARSLRYRETKTIGIIVPDITNWFFGVIVRAIGEVTKTKGYSLIVCDANEDPEAEVKALETLRERQVSGIIRCPVGGPETTWKMVLQSGIPVIEVDRRSGLAKCDAVVIDDEKAGALAAEHLIRLGHSRIATIAGPQHLSNGRGRLLGFQKALAKASITLEPNLIEYGDFRAPSGHECTKRLVQSRKRPTAIFIANSEMTGGAIAALRELKIDIPRQLSLIGFDDARWTRFLDPPLTMITHPTADLGRAAADLLLDRLGGPHPKRRAKIIRFAPALVIRESTAPSPQT